MLVNRQSFDYAVFCEQMAIWMPCQHAHAVPHRKIKANTRVPYFRLQCPDCGAVLSQQLKYAIVEDYKGRGYAIPDWNQALYDSWGARRSCAQEVIRKTFAWDFDGWWDRYQIYLSSEEWQTIRACVMKRDKDTCQQCTLRPATQVHHLTYERAGHENAEDLIAVCWPCHKSLHPRL